MAPHRSFWVRRIVLIVVVFLSILLLYSWASRLTTEATPTPEIDPTLTFPAPAKGGVFCIVRSATPAASQE